MAEINFQISSRATILLGRENIAKAEGALIELIKNTYDADASLCYILFDADNDCLYIIDNGTGMSEDAIKDNWMVIGTENKRTEYLSNKNRIRSGEKGIGRFALDRLGSVCELYTKTATSKNVLYWKVNWSDFEKSNQMINEVKAELEYKSISFTEALPSCVKENLSNIDNQILENVKSHAKIKFHTGTIIKISSLRDNWTQNKLEELKTSMGYLIPPQTTSDEFNISLQFSQNTIPELLKFEIIDNYDYMLKSKFDGENFTIDLYRNEFDLLKMPEDIFDIPIFKNFPYRKIDFEEKKLSFNYTISELLNKKLNPAEKDDLINKVKEIGAFSFDFTYSKHSIRRKSDYSTFFYKEISPYRKTWIKNNAGIKIYRDNFIVRPYGEQASDSFDWLGLNARSAANPAGASRTSWNVINNQVQGCIYISRIDNKVILDKSSREGLIENEYFKIFKNVLIAIITVFEKDRSNILNGFKQYYKNKDKEKNDKEKADKIISDYNDNPEKSNNKSISELKEEKKTLVAVLQSSQKEKEELISEIKLLRSLSTNGLITSALVHDLKSIKGNLYNRPFLFNSAIIQNNMEMLKIALKEAEKDDQFIASWISVITEQTKSDKRKRKKVNLYNTIKHSTEIMKPILNKRKIQLNITDDNNIVERPIFDIDFDSILYNLIINSVEAFTSISIKNPQINISLSTTNEDFILTYSDNGPGINGIFKNPYDIFDYGTTSKISCNGEKTGTGLGMYIINSTVSEYNGSCILPENNNGFTIQINIPLGGKSNVSR